MGVTRANLGGETLEKLKCAHLLPVKEHKARLKMVRQIV